MGKRRYRYRRRITASEAREEAKFGCLVTLVVICAALVHFLAQLIIFFLSLTALLMPLVFAWYYGKRQKRFQFLQQLQTSYPWLSWSITLMLIGGEIWLVKINWSVQYLAFGVGKIWIDSLTYVGLFNLVCGWLFLLICTRYNYQ